jgi:hypothetical protein
MNSSNTYPLTYPRIRALARSVLLVMGNGKKCQEVHSSRMARFANPGEVLILRAVPQLFAKQVGNTRDIEWRDKSKKHRF